MEAAVRTKGVGSEDREQRILDAAERVFASKGFGVSSMDQIAARAGIPRTRLHSYFASKEDLYVACVDRARKRLLERAAQAVAETEDPMERVAAFARVLFDEFDRERDSWWIFYGKSPVAAVDEMRRKNTDLVATLLERGWPGSEESKPSRGQYELVAAGLVGAGEMAGRWWVAHPDVPKQEVVARWTRFATGAIRDGLTA